MGLIQKIIEQQPLSLRFDPKRYWDARVRKKGLESVMQNSGRDKIERQKISEFLDLPEFKDVESVLDYGCGCGRFLPLLKERFKIVWATDFSAEMMKRAKANNGKGVEFCTHWYLRPVNMIFCFTVLMHIVSNLEWRRTLNRLSQVSKYILICDQFKLKKYPITARHCKIRKLQDYVEAMPDLEWLKFYPDAVNGLGVAILKIKEEEKC